ncbi:mhck ef2 kinase domain family protein [Colletotrichum musicola]|uniref:Mhck ef2 kinase domain family protein n=1 Tax=Colletotrichum musicola TaxID=2175873 RepID=A0A8H6N116_9PEZI|nr:mhck ef2 kinase domain family protein [Colletotrichum musicola]
MSKPPSASLSRSSKSRDDVQSLADSRLRASLSNTTSADQPPSYIESISRLSVSDNNSHETNGPANIRAPSRSNAPLREHGSASMTRQQLRSSRDRGSEPEPMASSFSNTSRLKSDSLTKITYHSMSQGSSSRTKIPAVDHKSMLYQLKRNIEEAKAAASPRNTSGLYKAAVSTDLLFLIDTTGSMRSYIDAAKNQVRSIVDDIHKAFLNAAEIRIAVVSYKDHISSPNVEFLDFTNDIPRVLDFVGELACVANHDTAEDVLGGIQQALNATWKHQTRCMVHIGDAPAHGRNLHDLSDYADNWITPGSEPHGLTYERLLRKLVQMHINYALLRITSDTDRMALMFANVYTDYMADAKLHPSNKYYGEQMSGKINSSGTAKLQFEEFQLGTTYSALRHLIVRAVTTSASRTATRLTRLSQTRTMVKPGDFKPGMVTYLTSLDEDTPVASFVEGEEDNVALETSPAQWDTEGWLDDTVQAEGFCPNIVTHDAKTLGNMMAHDDHIKLGVMELTIYARSKPFSQGAMRLASYAKTAFSSDKFVVKTSKKAACNKMEHLAEEMRAQALCKAFALEFNALLGSEHEPLDFIVTTALKRRGAGGDDCVSLEPFIPGEYVKYNNNCGWVNDSDGEINKAAQAFSHFTFERSWGSFLVSDLQGVGRNLTDPGIHTKDEKRFPLNDTNLGDAGFKFFFTSHECNDICRRLKLQTTKEQCASGDFQFREDWPTMNTTVCCSSKLCRRIIQLATANKSSEFAGHFWCDGCWPQLQKFMDTYYCEEGDGPHEFAVSRFFYESQGEPVPRKCLEHREIAQSVSSAASVGASLWNRSKTADSLSKKSLSGRTWG